MKFTLPGTFTAVSLLLAAVTPVNAGDDGLYSAPPPPDSAFLRVLNGDDIVAPVVANGNSMSIQPHRISRYAIVKAGEVKLEGLNHDGPLTLKIGGYYTLAVLEGEASAKLYVDAPLVDPAKSRVYFYNLTDTPDVDLYVPAAKQNALEKLTPVSSASVELKAPLQIELVAKTQAGELAKFEGVALKRRAGVSLVLFGGKGKYTSLVAPNAVEPVTSK